MRDQHKVLAYHGVAIAPADSPPEIRVNSEVVALPSEVDGGLEVPLEDLAPHALDDPKNLEVWRSDERIDDPATTQRRNQRKDKPQRRQPPAATPTLDVDTATPGPYGTERLDYQLDPLEIAGYAAASEVQAEVTRPIDAPGPRPLVLIVHGRHSTCYVSGANPSAWSQWPCVSTAKPLPSYRGYRYLADILASQGYIAVSISVNAINAQDALIPDLGAGARSELIRHHLTLWAQWNSTGGGPFGDLFKNAVDLDKVALIGHSRGGEAVHRAAVDSDSSDPFRIRSVITYGATAFGHQVNPTVPSLNLLPACDGDVTGLMGQVYVDRSRDIAPSTALRTSVTIAGADHNFFNTEWTPGLAAAVAQDDWTLTADPACGASAPSRLTAEEQEHVGVVYTIAELRLALANDQTVLPLLDGTRVKSAAIGAAEVGVDTVGGDATPLFLPLGTDTEYPVGAGMTARECPWYISVTGTNANPIRSAPANSVCAANGANRLTPHANKPVASSRPAEDAVELTWAAPGTSVRLPVSSDSESSVDISGRDNVDVRIANDPAAADSAGVSVRIVDNQGRSVDLKGDRSRVDDWGSTLILPRAQAHILRASLQRIPKSAIDLTHIVAVELVATSGPSRAWVLDVRATSKKIVEPQVLDLAQLSIESVEQPEGNDGARTVQVSVERKHEQTGPGRVWVQTSTSTGQTGAPYNVLDGYYLDVPPGPAGSVKTFDVTLYGNTYPNPASTNPSSRVLIDIIADSGLMTGSYRGGATTVDDD